VPGSTEVHSDMLRLNLRGVEKGPNERASPIFWWMQDARWGHLDAPHVLAARATPSPVEHADALHQHDE